MIPGTFLSAALRPLSALLLLACPATAAPEPATETITIRGSNTMFTLNRELTESYGSVDPTVDFVLEGKGSETGFVALLHGRADIAASSRPIRPEEVEAFRSKHGGEPLEVVVAVDGVGIYVHTSNPVGRLTVAQLGDILAGEIRNWREVGGINASIDVYNRNRNSGTRAFVREHVLGGRPFSPHALDVSSWSRLGTAVSANPHAIVYSGEPYAPDVSVLRIAMDESSIAFRPTDESIASGEYPLARPLYYYVRPPAAGSALAKFLDWVVTSEAQRVVRFVGHFSLPGTDPTPIEAAYSQDSEPHVDVVRVTPSNMKEHGFVLAITAGSSSRAGHTEITVLFSEAGERIRDVEQVVMRMGDAASVSVPLNEDRMLDFTVQSSILRESWLEMVDSGSGSSRMYRVLLADFCPLD